MHFFAEKFFPGAGATVLNGKIFVAGGFDDNAPLASVEVYNPVITQWTSIQERNLKSHPISEGLLRGPRLLG